MSSSFLVLLPHPQRSAVPFLIMKCLNATYSTSCREKPDILVLLPDSPHFLPKGKIFCFLKKKKEDARPSKKKHVHRKTLKLHSSLCKLCVRKQEKTTKKELLRLAHYYTSQYLDICIIHPCFQRSFGDAIADMPQHARTCAVSYWVIRL